MKRLREFLVATFLTAVGLLLVSVTPALAAEYCVRCTEPDKTYMCRIETSSALQNEKGLQLFCIIRTSRDGGHRECKIDQTAGGQCSGEVKSYSFNAPAIPDKVREAIAKRQQSSPGQTTSTDLPQQKGGEPETLIEMTRGAVGASKDGIKNAGSAVGSATSTTREKVGGAARSVGRGVARAAGKVGGATKKTGGAVGSAAKTAWDCVTSLFKDCRGTQ